MYPLKVRSTKAGGTKCSLDQMWLRLEVCGVGFFYFSAPGSKILMLVSGVTLDLKHLINSYSSYTPVMFFELLKVYVITLLATSAPV